MTQGRPAAASSPEASSRPVAGSGPSPRYARYVLGLLFVAYVFNFIDRQILSILLQPIKEDLGASDTAMGLLTGVTFALFYACAGLPIARLADTGMRRTIIVVGLVVWSAMTAVSGLARSFGELTLARIGVGVGEAAFVPPAHSLISDYFPPARRATALAVFSMGVYVGAAFGFLLGGWIAELFGWRQAFFAVGLPGLLLAVVVRFTLVEPQRGHAEGLAVAAEADPPREVARFLSGLPSFRNLALAGALHSFGAYAFAAWGPAFFIRVHGMGMGELGTWLGIILGLGGAAGSIAGGVLADRLGRGDARWQLWIPASATILQIPIVFCVLLSATKASALIALVPSAVLSAMWVGPVFALTQALVRPRMRAIAAAILVFVINLIGLGLGPLLVGALNDALSPRFGTGAIRYSLMALTATNVWAAAHFLLAARTVRADLGARNRLD